MCSENNDKINRFHLTSHSLPHGDLNVYPNLTSHFEACLTRVHGTYVLIAGATCTAEHLQYSTDETVHTKLTFIVNTLQIKLWNMVVIALLGASGPSGQEVIKEAMNRGISVRAVVKLTSKTPSCR